MHPRDVATLEIHNYVIMVNVAPDARCVAAQPYARTTENTVFAETAAARGIANTIDSSITVLHAADHRYACISGAEIIVESVVARRYVLMGVTGKCAGSVEGVRYAHIKKYVVSVENAKEHKILAVIFCVKICFHEYMHKLNIIIFCC